VKVTLSKNVLAARELPAPSQEDAISLHPGESIDDPGLVKSWQATRRPVEAHFYERRAHGFASGTSAATKIWEKEFLAWMQDRGLLARKP
jgi:hypothetical protein